MKTANRDTIIDMKHGFNYPTDMKSMSADIHRVQDRPYSCGETCLDILSCFASNAGCGDLMDFTFPFGAADIQFIAARFYGLFLEQMPLTQAHFVDGFTLCLKNHHWYIVYVSEIDNMVIIMDPALKAPIYEGFDTISQATVHTYLSEVAIALRVFGGL